jgi:hypothetical protein
MPVIALEYRSLFLIGGVSELMWAPHKAPVKTPYGASFTKIINVEKERLK